MFARWEDEAAVESFMADHALGRQLAAGWHVRMEFLRRWSRLAALPDLPARVGEWDPDEPVVAVTLARMRLLEVPRFLKWGKPVERLVRDHPGTTLALAAMRPPRTISTFSVWRSVREMEEMVHGHSTVPEPDRHAAAMVEQPAQGLPPRVRHPAVPAAVGARLVAGAERDRSPVGALPTCWLRSARSPSY